VRLQCGANTLCTASGSTLTFDVKTMFDGWYSEVSTFGSLVTLRLPLTIQGDVHGSVSVTLRNANGASAPVIFQLP